MMPPVGCAMTPPERGHHQWALLDTFVLPERTAYLFFCQWCLVSIKRYDTELDLLTEQRPAAAENVAS